MKDRAEIKLEGRTIPCEDRRSSTGKKGNDTSEVRKTVAWAIGFIGLMLALGVFSKTMMSRPDLFMDAILFITPFAFLSWVVVQVNQENQS